MIPLVFSSLLSCVPLGAEPSSSTIVWSGTILDDPYNTAEPTALTGAQVTALETTSDQPIVGIESASTPGYYSLEVPPDADITIRVSGPDHVSTVFRGTTPAGRGIWFTGALFARQIYMDNRVVLHFLMISTANIHGTKNGNLSRKTL